MTETILVCEGLGQSLVQEPFITAAVVAPKLTERCTAAAVRSAQLRAIGEGSVRIALACDETILDFDPARQPKEVADARREVAKKPEMDVPDIGNTMVPDRYGSEKP